MDDVTGHVAFVHFGFAAQSGRQGCGFSGHVASPVVLRAPEGCMSGSVFPAVGSLAGAIAAASRGDPPGVVPKASRRGAPRVMA